jgi:hypothetical protein
MPDEDVLQRNLIERLQALQEINDLAEKHGIVLNRDKPINFSKAVTIQAQQANYFFKYHKNRYKMLKEKSVRMDLGQAHKEN